MKYLLIVLIAILLSACETDSNKKVIDKTDMRGILNNCKGHAIVTAKGYNAGNFESYRYYMIIRDDSLNCYEYIGAKYDVEVGDTLK